MTRQEMIDAIKFAQGLSYRVVDRRADRDKLDHHYDMVIAALENGCPQPVTDTPQGCPTCGGPRPCDRCTTSNVVDLDALKGRLERERLRAATEIVKLIADDSWAITFQSLGQYRSALLKVWRDSAPPPVMDTPQGCGWRVDDDGVWCGDLEQHRMVLSTHSQAGHTDAQKIEALKLASTAGWLAGIYQDEYGDNILPGPDTATDMGHDARTALRLLGLPTE